MKLIQESIDIINDKNFLNIFSHIVMRVTENELVVQASDSIIHVQHTIAVEGIQNGAIAVHADRLFAVLRSIPDTTVHVMVQDSTCIVCPSDTDSYNARFELRTIDAGEYITMPALDDAIQVSLPVRTFCDIITKSIISISNDESRFFLTGVYLTQKEGFLHMIATDGKRLSVVHDPLTEMPDTFEGKIIAPKILRFVKRHMEQEGKVVLHIGQQLLSIETDDGLKIIAPHIEGQFPDYNRVIPQSQKNTLTLNRLACIDAIKRAALFVEATNKILFHIQKNKVHIYAQDDNFGKAEEFVPVEYAGEEILFAFNYKFLLEPLLVEESSDITLHFSDAQKVVTITADTEQQVPSFHIVMPMRVMI